MSKKYEVFFEQINRTVIEVTADSSAEAAEKAKRKWRREWAWPPEPYVQPIEVTIAHKPSTFTK